MKFIVKEKNRIMSNGDKEGSELWIQCSFFFLQKKEKFIITSTVTQVIFHTLWPTKSHFTKQI